MARLAAPGTILSRVLANRASVGTMRAAARGLTSVAKAASMSRSLLALRIRICCPTDRATRSMSLVCGSDSGLRGLTRTATTDAGGKTSRISSSRFVVSSEVKRFKPVALPPGRLRLVTNPNFTGSSAARKTIGIVNGCRLGRKPRGNPADGNHSNPALDQVREQCRQALEFAVGPAEFDRD